MIILIVDSNIWWSHYVFASIIMFRRNVFQWGLTVRSCELFIFHLIVLWGTAITDSPAHLLAFLFILLNVYLFTLSHDTYVPGYILQYWRSWQNWSKLTSDQLILSSPFSWVHWKFVWGSSFLLGISYTFPRTFSWAPSWTSPTFWSPSWATPSASR